MKKLTVLIGIILFAISGIRAQNIISIRTGWTSSSAKIDALNNLNIKDEKISGFHAAIYTELPLGYGLFFQPEIGYTQMGFGGKESLDLKLLGLDIPAGAKVTTRVNYVQMPLQLKYYFNNGGLVQPFVHLGPTIGYATSGTINASANFILNFNILKRDLNMSSETINRWEVGASGGAGIKFDLPEKVDIVMGFNYYHAFNNWLSDATVNADIYNRATQVYLGAAINI